MKYILLGLVIFFVSLFGGAFVLDCFYSNHWIVYPVKVSSVLGVIVGFFTTAFAFFKEYFE